MRQVVTPEQFWHEKQSALRMRQNIQERRLEGTGAAWHEGYAAAVESLAIQQWGMNWEQLVSATDKAQMMSNMGYTPQEIRDRGLDI